MLKRLFHGTTEKKEILTSAQKCIGFHFHFGLIWNGHNHSLDPLRSMMTAQFSIHAISRKISGTELIDWKSSLSPCAWTNEKCNYYHTETSGTSSAFPARNLQSLARLVAPPLWGDNANSFNFELNSSQLSCYSYLVVSTRSTRVRTKKKTYHKWDFPRLNEIFMLSDIQHNLTHTHTMAEVEWYIALLNCKIHPSHHENLVSCRSDGASQQHQSTLSHIV